MTPTSRHQPATFNSPLEAGVRAAAILVAAYPRAFDLQRLIAFDHLLVHTGDVGGPESLHPPAPMRTAELLVRRRLIERAVLLMMTRDLVTRVCRDDGIRYVAGENAAVFFSLLQSDYITALRERARWLIDGFGDLSEPEFRKIVQRYFDRWVEEFQTAERSLGVDP